MIWQERAKGAELLERNSQFILSKNYYVGMGDEQINKLDGALPDAVKKHISVEREGSCTTIKMSGIWEKNTAEALVHYMRTEFKNQPTPWLAYDMRGLKGFDVLSRPVMVRVHQEICKNTRCVFIADRSRFRGLALWILRLSQDKHASVVRTRAQADDWLAEDHSQPVRKANP